MCGIAGAFGSQATPDFRAGVAHIVASQYWRGPDFHATETVRGGRSHAVLGHSRLAIIDLTPQGNQPMWDAQKRYCITFNGEIYNYIELRSELEALGHRFHTASDTEVILEAFKQWDVDAIGRFNGMFAFGLLDTQAERLLLVRDRFGVKPLYYCRQGEAIYFASSTTPLAEVLSLAPDLRYVARGLRYLLYDCEDYAPYEGMKALRAGHYADVGVGEDGRLTFASRSYYDLRERVSALAESLAARPLGQLAESLSDLLEDAVRIRLRADVPIAVSLSGGLDSSSIAALAAANEDYRLHAFNFGHPYDLESEGRLVDRLRRMAKLDVTYVWPDADFICDTYLDALDAQGAPFPGGSIIAQFCVFSAVQAAGFKVTLGGQGGDEVFMGYRKFQLFHLRRLLAQRHYARAFLFAMSLVPTFLAERVHWGDTWRQRHRYTRKSGLETCLRLPDPEPMEIGYAADESVISRQLSDILYASLPTLLRYEDGNSMGNSVESRLPMVDYRLVEFGVALPVAAKLRGGYGKWILRQAVDGRIPEAIRSVRCKRGFDVQQTEWIRDGLGNRLRSLLHERSREITQWLDPRTNLDEVFCNENLCHSPTAFAEATTLIWLSQCRKQAREPLAAPGDQRATT